MVVADAKESLTITGNGDVVEPHDGVVGELNSSAHSSMIRSSGACKGCSYAYSTGIVVYPYSVACYYGSASSDIIPEDPDIV